jgi:hypothetical protein
MDANSHTCFRSAHLTSIRYEDAVSEQWQEKHCSFLIQRPPEAGIPLFNVYIADPQHDAAGFALRSPSSRIRIHHSSVSDIHGIRASRKRKRRLLTPHLRSFPFRYTSLPSKYSPSKTGTAGNLKRSANRCCASDSGANDARLVSSGMSSPFFTACDSHAIQMRKTSKPPSQ